MSSVVTNEITILGMFLAQRISDHQARCKVKLVFDDDPAASMMRRARQSRRAQTEGQIDVSER